MSTGVDCTIKARLLNAESKSLYRLVSKFFRRTRRGSSLGYSKCWNWIIRIHWSGTTEWSYDSCCGDGNQWDTDQCIERTATSHRISYRGQESVFVVELIRNNDRIQCDIGDLFASSCMLCSVETVSFNGIRELFTGRQRFIRVKGWQWQPPQMVLTIEVLVCLGRHYWCYWQIKVRAIDVYVDPLYTRGIWGFLASSVSYTRSESLALKIMFRLPIPCALFNMLLISIYWQASLRKYSVGSSFLDKLKIPLFILAILIFLIDIVYDIVDGLEITLPDISSVYAVLYAVMSLSVRILVALTLLALYLLFSYWNKDSSDPQTEFDCHDISRSRHGNEEGNELQGLIFNRYLCLLLVLPYAW